MAHLSLGPRPTHVGRVVDLGLIDSIPLGEGRAYSIGSRTIAVFRPRGGGLFAHIDRCPQRGGPLADGMIEGETIACPLHARRFELGTGRCVNADGAVRAYAAFEANGRISVVLDGDG